MTAYLGSEHWKPAVLQDLVLLQRGFDITKAQQKEGEIPVYSSSGLSSWHNEAKVEGPGIIIGRKGTLGSVHYSESDYWPHDTTLWSKSLNGNNPRFVYYALKCLGLEKFNVGGANPTLNRNHIHGLPIFLPGRNVQDTIVSILSAYDDLIETNRRRIALLEEAARLLYREWFVHFRFPGHEHVPLTDGLPEGWERFALSDLADFINGFAFKPAHLGDTGLPIVKIPELKQGVTEKTPRNDGEMVPEKYHLKDGDLLFSWSGTLAVNVWTSGPALLNQHLFHVVPRGRVSRGFLMCAIREALIAFENQTVGATMKHIRRSALDRVFVPLPDRAFMSPVKDTLTNTYDQLIVLHQQNQKLAQARDLLLPRLMNGEIAV
ncbi:type I restriction enzyme S subunit [Palleronia aestuarii]|uniref:Type I restriction enzyme S subunit n=1 Tax=Palleronia aestuarii TaxID=568105 RepID=A0A2W7MXP2_9RHOB|nr:restriction endonuclease subunit S [Palleronia aestuarii]PZX10947.1 type I restriction enzyme S subunit [Palleronia aestuarii]